MTVETVNIALGVSHLFTAGMVACLALPLVRRKVPMNHLYGVRFRKAFESEELWYDINEYGGRMLLRWSIPLGLIGVATFFLPLGENIPRILLVACAPLIVLVPALQSWRSARKIP